MNQQLNFKKLYVTYFGFDVEDYIVRNLFQQYGECICSFTTKVSGFQRSKYAFVTYTNTSDAKNALRNLDRVFLGTATLFVEYAIKSQREIEEEQRRREEERRRREEERRRIYEERQRERERRLEEQRRQREERKRMEIERRKEEARKRREQERKEVAESINYSRTSIFIKNIPASVTVKQMKEIFTKYNPLYVEFQSQKDTK